jgi:cytoskeletal protein RodZ
MREIWNSRLSREILIILIIKVVLIFLIWWIFFRTPDAAVPASQASNPTLLTRSNDR